ncbi:hypothetical protein AC578_838 [Pseudocercospora eumusae]|uniref:Uncharacterized protein n=1 Tax=Pseudocercospora eumusae TaxID=321146 RepID=A0A139GZQ4_9PEZI|nr:hypothetical protein AC578_838 [Pseudocercospora eumusae]
MNDSPIWTASKSHWSYTSANDWMNMKIKASEKPDSSDKTRTMGSVKNILKGRIQVMRTSLAENRSLKGTSSSGPQTLASGFAFLRFFAILFIMMVILLAETTDNGSQNRATDR